MLLWTHNIWEKCIFIALNKVLLTTSDLLVGDRSPTTGVSFFKDGKL